MNNQGQPLTPIRDEDAQLALLRELVSGHLRTQVDAAQAQLDAFEARFGNQKNAEATVADSLAGALRRAHAPRSRAALNEALSAPWMGAAAHLAEHELPAATQALSPFMLPAISQAVKERLASFSNAMQRASPTRRIAWKIKSLQTGLPLETVMEQDLDPFSVHRILVVEMPGGNLLASYRVQNSDHALARSANHEEEAFATAALLTALRGFVRDAGIGEAAAELSSIDIGKRTLHIAQQGTMMIAVEASGALAQDLETTIHAELFPQLRAATTPAKREQVLAKWHADEDNGPRATSGGPQLWVGAAIIGALVISLWQVSRWIERNDMHMTRQRIAASPGVAAVSVDRIDKGWKVNVAADPTSQIEPAFDASLTPRGRISLEVDPILSLDPTSIARALQLTLPPPMPATLIVSREKVRVVGRVPMRYVEALRDHPRIRLANLPLALDSAIISN